MAPSALGTFLALVCGMNIETTVKRTFHGVALLLIGVVAYFQARGAGQLIGMALVNGAERKSTLPEHDGKGSTPPPTTKSGQVKLRRSRRATHEWRLAPQSFNAADTESKTWGCARLSGLVIATPHRRLAIEQWA